MSLLAKLRKQKRAYQKVYDRYVKKLKPQVSFYRTLYPKSPVLAVFKKLESDQKLSLSKEEMLYLSDLITEYLSQEVTNTTMGFSITRNITTWLKGRKRQDVY